MFRKWFLSIIACGLWATDSDTQRPKEEIMEELEDAGGRFTSDFGDNVTLWELYRLGLKYRASYRKAISEERALYAKGKVKDEESPIYIWEEKYYPILVEEYYGIAT